MSRPAPHLWWECRAAIVLTKDADPRAVDLTTRAIARVWAKMNDLERHQFHLFTCEGSRTEAVMHTLERMQEALAKEGVE